MIFRCLRLFPAIKNKIGGDRGPNFLICIGGSRGHAGCMPPLWDPILLIFAHIFTKKHPHQRSTPPLTGARHPTTGNPGSATDLLYSFASRVHTEYLKGICDALEHTIYHNYYIMQFRMYKHVTCKCSLVQNR